MSDTFDRPHRTGAFWLDMVVALSAVAISIVSLWVASRSDKTQERLLAASVWPYVEFYTGNYEDNVSTIDFALENGGVGPARIRWLTFDYKGKPMRNAHEFLTTCCEPHSPHAFKMVLTSTVTHTVIVPHDSVRFINIPGARSDKAAFKLLDEARRHVRIRVCYCSALDDCWLFDNATEEDPKPVSNCLPIPATAFNN